MFLFCVCQRLWAISDVEVECDTNDDDDDDDIRLGEVKCLVRDPL